MNIIHKLILFLPFWLFCWALNRYSCVQLQIYSMNNPGVESLRLQGLDSLTVGTDMNRLAIKTSSVNLGQGYPSWQPPEFFLKNLQQSFSSSSHQYVRTFGSLSYTKAIAEYHKKDYGEIDHQNNICVVQGAMEGLNCAFMGLINPGEEVILFDPSFSGYRIYIQMAGGKAIGIPLIPRYNQTKAELLAKIETRVNSDEKDQWDIDFEALQKSFNEKTKILLINSPHNPVGKVFRHDQLSKLCKILQKNPQVIVIEDNVYQGMTFDDMYEKALPKIAFLQGMYERTLSIYSAGKIFGATGIRSGWVIGPAPLIKAIRSVHQYNVFCQYNVIENTITQSLQEITKPESNYLKDLATKLRNLRNLLIKELLSIPYDISLWIPKGGYFVLVDISRVQVMEKYALDQQGKKRAKDYAFAYQLAHQNKVVCVPCSPSYDAKDVHIGQKLIRFAFCKEEEMLLQASRRLKK